MSDLVEKITRISQAVDGFKARHLQEVQELRERIEELEMCSRAPGRTGAPEVSSVERDHLQLFARWVKTNDASTRQELSNIEKELERKQVIIGNDAQGGVAVPTVILREIERLELQISPIRSLVRVVPAASGDFHALVNERGTTAGWVGESDSRTETETSRLRRRSPTSGELYAYPKTSEWAMNDIFFDVAAWLSEECAQAFAVAEESAVLVGDGANKPTGMLNTAPNTTPDFASPARDPAAFEAIEVQSSQSPAVAEITPESLVDVIYRLHSQYRAGASWIMNSETAGQVMKMKDAQGRFLWTQSLAAGQPNMLLGYPVQIVEGLPGIAPNAFPIGFGNWNRAYLLIDIATPRITRDEVTQPGFVKFYVRRRVGGCVLNNHAAKFLKPVTS